MYIGLCDDDKIIADFIKKVIVQYGKDKDITCNVEYFESGEKLLSAKENIDDLDVVFLDVNMEGLDGIKTAEKIREKSDKIFIVFITAYITYSLEGYKVDAIRYILKEDFERMSEHIIESLDVITSKMVIRRNQKTIVHKYVEGECALKVSEIMYVISEKHKLIFHLKKAGCTEYSIYMRLDEIENEIDNEEFLRIYKSVLINMNYIKKYEKDEVTMVDDAVVYVPRAKNKEMKRKYMEFRGRR